MLVSCRVVVGLVLTAACDWVELSVGRLVNCSVVNAGVVVEASKPTKLVLSVLAIIINGSWVVELRSEKSCSSADCWLLKALASASSLTSCSLAEEKLPYDCVELVGSASCCRLPVCCFSSSGSCGETVVFRKESE